MAILIDEKTRILVQGITGKQGAIATKEMLSYGSNVVCGVTPGKGGEYVEGLSVYNSVREALQLSVIDASVVYVPPFFVKNAVFEAIDAGVKLIVIVTECVPLHDSAKIIAYAREHSVRLIGPSSVGIISPGRSKVGSVGGFDRAFSPGKVGILSKSGGMLSETALLLTQRGIGQSTAVGIGGDVLIGSSFSDLLSLFEKDEETDAVVVFGEIGGSYEEELAAFIKHKNCTKPVVAFISGAFADHLPSIPLGHAGAIIEGASGTRTSKVSSLKAAGVLVAEVHHELVDLLEKALSSWNGKQK
ncbi:MAG TPA: CoA-binding protein [Candidatus Nanoarchaeia archaeon]|nr:CoA-binding protein [Candidatus Nanoarchaeia archaeon]